MKANDFISDWNKTHTSSPSFQDVLDWADQKQSEEIKEQINHNVEKHYKQGYHDAVEKACQWITEHIDIPYKGEFIDDEPVASDYIDWCENRLECAKTIADAFRKAMEE